MPFLPPQTKYLSLSLVLLSNTTAFGQSSAGPLPAPAPARATAAPATQAARASKGIKRKPAPCKKKKWTPPLSNNGENLSPLGQAVQNKTLQGDYVGAIALCQERINTQANDWDAFLNRAIVKRQIGDLKGAIADLDQALSLKPDSAAALVNRAAAYRRLNEQKLARADVDRAIEIAPRYYQAYTERGSLLMSQGDFNGALADYNTATTINPDLSKRTGRYVQPNLAANMNMAVAENNGQVSVTGNGLNLELAQLSKKCSASANVEPGNKVLNQGQSNATTTGTGSVPTSSPAQPELSPGELAQLNNRAVEEINHKQFLNAIYTLKDLLKLSPNYDNARDNLVIAYNNYGLELAEKNPKESLKQFRAALYLDPRQNSARKNLEAMISELGMNQKDDQDRLNLAQQCLKENDPEGAYVELIETLKLKNSVETRKKLSETLLLLDGQKSLLANNAGLVGLIENFALNQKLKGASYNPTNSLPATEQNLAKSTALEQIQATSNRPAPRQEIGTKIKLESPSAIPADLIGKELPQSKLRTNLNTYGQKLKPILLNKNKPQSQTITGKNPGPIPHSGQQTATKEAQFQVNSASPSLPLPASPAAVSASASAAPSSLGPANQIMAPNKEESTAKATITDQISLDLRNEEEIAQELQSQNFDLVSLPSKLQNDPESILLLTKELTGKGANRDAAYLLVKLIDFLHQRSAEQVSMSLLDNALESLADIYIKENYWGKAEPLLRELVSLREKSKAAEDPLLGKAHADYAQVLNQLGQQELANKHKEKSLVIINRSF